MIAIMITCAMLSCFSRVQFFVTPWTVAHQTPLSRGFSRQEYWSWVSVPSSIGSSGPRHWTQELNPLLLRFLRLLHCRQILDPCALGEACTLCSLFNIPSFQLRATFCLQSIILKHFSKSSKGKYPGDQERLFSTSL